MTKSLLGSLFGKEEEEGDSSSQSDSSDSPYEYGEGLKRLRSHVELDSRKRFHKLTGQTPSHNSSSYVPVQPALPFMAKMSFSAVTPDKSLLFYASPQHSAIEGGSLFNAKYTGQKFSPFVLPIDSRSRSPAPKTTFTQRRRSIGFEVDNIQNRALDILQSLPLPHEVGLQH